MEALESLDAGDIANPGNGLLQTQIPAAALSQASIREVATARSPDSPADPEQSSCESEAAHERAIVGSSRAGVVPRALARTVNLPVRRVVLNQAT